MAAVTAGDLDRVTSASEDRPGPDNPCYRWPFPGREQQLFRTRGRSRVSALGRPERYVTDMGDGTSVEAGAGEAKGRRRRRRETGVTGWLAGCQQGDCGVVAEVRLCLAMCCTAHRLGKGI